MFVRIFWNLVCVCLAIDRIQGFLLDQLNDGLRCKGVTMLCPPMCQKYDSRGCVSCDCGNINPANPGNIGSSSGAGFNPANPLGTGSGIQHPGQCNNAYQTCACAPTVDSSSGCLHCSCGQPPVSTNQPLTQPTTAVRSSHSNVVTSTRAATAVKQQTQTTTKQHSNPSVIITPISTHKATLNTKLTNIATAPALSAVTSLPTTTTTRKTTTTQAAFVCPGIFNCSLVCFAGFAMDAQGCPQCQCAPIPTDLP